MYTTTLNFANRTANYIKINLLHNKNALIAKKGIQSTKVNVRWVIIPVLGRVQKLRITNRIMFVLNYYQRKKMIFVMLRQCKI